jgi:GH25 family lysozyme M1 (1,4-beta-N-acetylmuramidase)
LEAWTVTKPASTTRRLVRALVAVAAAALTATTGNAYAYVLGVDTSNHQHSSTTSINWSSVANDGVKFAFLKATEGTSYQDPYFKADWAASAKVGIYHGAYHFARPSTAAGSAVQQADYFASFIGPQTSRGTLPPVLDLETTGGLSPRQLISWVQQFLTELQTRTGRNPIIYTSPYFWIDNLNNSTAFHDYPLWIAHYGVSSPTVPGQWPTWSFWQSTSTGRIQGISGNTDKDVFNGSMSQLQKFALAYTKPASQLSLTVSNTAPTIDQSIKLSGSLQDVNGNNLAQQPVQLQWQPQGSTSWTTLTTRNTGPYGGYRYWTAATGPGSYRAVYAGTTSYRGSSATPVAVTLTPVASSLTLSAPTSSTNAGTQLPLAGTLTAGRNALASRTVTVYRQVSGSTSWSRVGTVTTDSSGAYQLDTTAMETASYQAKYTGETAYRPATASAGPVTVTRNPATLNMAVSNQAPYANQSVSMTGRLVSGSTPIVGRTVRVQQQLPGSTSWQSIAWPRTDSTGGYTYSQRMTQGASYRAVFRGDSLYKRATTAPVAVTITPPQRTVTDLTARRTSIHPGGSVLLHGRLTAGGKGVARTVRLWQRFPGSSTWRFVYRTATVLPDGTCRIDVSPRRTTIYQLRFAGGNVYTSSSRTLRISVS